MFKHLKLFGTVAVIGLVLLTLAACGATAPTPDNAVVRVTENDMTMKLDVASVPAGKVTFIVVNEGKVDHELVLLRTDKDPKTLAMSTGKSKVDEAASGENVGEV